MELSVQVMPMFTGKCVSSRKRNLALGELAVPLSHAITQILRAVVTIGICPPPYCTQCYA